jgi:signal transduction histidine kinase
LAVVKTPAWSRGVLAAGVAYALVYLAAVSLLPPPASAALRVVLGNLFLVIPAAFAAAATAHAAHRSLATKKAFRSAVLEWVMAAVGGYFLVMYFAVLPRSDARYAWFLVTIQEALPGYNPWNVAWILLFFSIAAAALGPTGEVWVRPSWSEAGDRRRARLAVLALAVPPLIDLACRAAGGQPALAAPRTDLTLACFSTLSLLVALRVRQAARPAAARERPEPVEAGGAHAEPSDYLEFASGVAHELNNPLMAVAGWAELARRRGAPEPPLQALGEATAAAAAAVARLQQLVRSGRVPGKTR